MGMGISYGLQAVYMMIAESLGGWDAAIRLLVFLMIGEYVTGILGSIRTKQVSVDMLLWGLIRKAVILMVVCMSAALDQWVGGDSALCRAVAICFYAGREGLLLVQHMQALGLPMPYALTKLFAQLKDSGKEAD